jgi:hypothetical protein
VHQQSTIREPRILKSTTVAGSSSLCIGRSLIHDQNAGFASAGAALLSGSRGVLMEYHIGLHSLGQFGRRGCMGKSLTRAEKACKVHEETGGSIVVGFLEWYVKGYRTWIEVR